MQMPANIIFLLLFSLYSQLQCKHATDRNTYAGRDTVQQISSKKINNIAQFQKIANIPVPRGYKRPIAQKGSFAYYLRHLSLNTKDKKVYSYDGNVIMDENNGYQFAVIDMDIGKRDLQQCADAVMRLRAEFLYQQKKYADIHFNFLSDNKARYYTQYAKNDRSYLKFRKYMDYIFAYANTASLKKELKKVDKLEDMQIGDVFIQSKRPFGHAVIVVDMAVNMQTGEKIFMVAQSFMPAQSIHILKNYNENLSPWYSANFSKTLELPSWTFFAGDLKRF